MQQPRYVIEPETCKYSSTLRGYNKWYIAKLDLKKETTNPNEMKIKDELVLQGMTQAVYHLLLPRKIEEYLHVSVSIA